MGHTRRASMGNDAADIDNDRRPDMVVLDMLPYRQDILNATAGAQPYELYMLKRRFGYHHQMTRNTLQLNRGHRRFSEIGYLAGIYATDWSWAALFCDLDNDGFKDLFIPNGVYHRPNDLDYIGHVSTPAMQAALEGAIDAEDLALLARMPQVPLANYAFRNNGDLTFTSEPNPSSDRYGYPMGIGIGDYNNDSRIDFFFSNVSTTPPRFLAKGDLRDDQIFHTPLFLFRNDGGFKFTDVAAETKVADYEFSWGIVLEDLNNDGREDALIAQNYISLPLQKIFRLPGRVLMQLPDGTFGSASEATGLVNRNYEISPLVADFNDDGYLDVIRVNLDGPSRAFLNGGGPHRFLKVRLPDKVHSPGAVVEVILPGGKKLAKQFTSGEGLASDQSHVLIFGLGPASSVEEVNVYYASGTIQRIARRTIGTTLVIQ